MIRKSRRRESFSLSWGRGPGCGWRCFKSFARRFHCRRRTRAALHPRRRHLPGQPFATADRLPGASLPGLRGGRRSCRKPGWELFQQLERRFPCAVFRVPRLRRFSNRVVVAGTIFAHERLAHSVTRPIKGTRPRDADPTRDAQLAYELQTSPKELAELVMITDLLRNDLGKVCEFGSVQTPELAQAGTIRAGAASGLHRRRPVAEGRDAFCRAGVVFSRRQHHRRAEIPRDGNH